jgi:hypothetical protein
MHARFHGAGKWEERGRMPERARGADVAGRRCKLGICNERALRLSQKCLPNRRSRQFWAACVHFRGIARITYKEMMKSLLSHSKFGLRILPVFALAMALCGGEGWVRAEANAALTPAQALTRKDLACAWNGNGRDSLSLTVNNSSNEPLEIDIPAGQIAANRAGAAKMIVLRGAQLRVPAHGSAEASLPAAALSSANALVSEPFEASSAAEPRMDGLLKFLSTQPDAPKETAQLATLCLLENIDFQKWEQFLAPQGAGDPASPPHPTPAQVTQAVDAMGILRSVAPDRSFALSNDAGLKLLALRNPWCRAKAMQLYGISLPGGDGQLPNLGQLLHTRPGDNCPICRQRALMQQGASDF